jgi:phosphoribosylpyrophosphate synthetase
MKTLNLAYPEKSDIKIVDSFGNEGKVCQFPDGQQDVIIKTVYGKTHIIGWEEEKFTIKSHFNSFRDLELIMCATKALRRLGVKEIHLYIPYLLGARSDREFVEGGTSYLVDVIAPVINSLGFESVTVMDVHSDVAAACINNLKVVGNSEFVEWAIEKIFENVT